jgi:uncharacterized membrane protein YhaH (DUF805 family)
MSRGQHFIAGLVLLTASLFFVNYLSDPNFVKRYSVSEIPATLSITFVVFLYVWTCIHAKRFHDRDHTGIFALYPVACLLLSAFNLVPIGRFGVLFLLFPIWDFFQTFIFGSKPGSTNYGGPVVDLPWYPRLRDSPLRLAAVMAIVSVVTYTYVSLPDLDSQIAAEEDVADATPKWDEPIPRPQRPPPKPAITPEAFATAAIADAKAFGIKNFDPQELHAPQPTKRYVRELQRLEAGNSQRFGPLELKVVHESIAYQRGATKVRSPHLILEVKNRSRHPLAYMLNARSEGRGLCPTRGSLKANALALAPNEVARLTICAGEGRVELSDLRAMEITRLGYHYISLLPAEALGIDAIGARAHLAEKGSTQRCATVPTSYLAASIKRGALLWEDVVDYYSRHSCERFKFPDGYHLSDTEIAKLPIETVEAPEPATVK